MHKSFKVLVVMVLALLSSACATLPPKNPDNVCDIFDEHEGWYEAATQVREDWGAPVHITMAILYQESAFRHDAVPPMDYFLGFIPIGRMSDAYGYPQAKDDVWSEYLAETDRWFAARDEFDDAIDFVGWYMHRSSLRNKVSKWDAYAQYLNYHEGHGGYARKTYLQKPWLQKVARKVEARAKRYSEQFWVCKAGF